MKEYAKIVDDIMDGLNKLQHHEVSTMMKFVKDCQSGERSVVKRLDEKLDNWIDQYWRDHPRDMEEAKREYGEVDLLVEMNANSRSGIERALGMIWTMVVGKTRAWIEPKSKYFDDDFFDQLKNSFGSNEGWVLRCAIESWVASLRGQRTTLDPEQFRETSRHYTQEWLSDNMKVMPNVWHRELVSIRNLNLDPLRIDEDDDGSDVEMIDLTMSHGRKRTSDRMVTGGSSDSKEKLDREVENRMERMKEGMRPDSLDADPQHR